MKKRILPELLAPAGSPSAFDAAVDAGADAVYVGGVSFNARINARNFTPEELRSAVARAHCYGVKVYVAANTLILDRELDDYIKAAEQAYLMGADALIVADLGAAREIKKRIPIELHGSTQLSGHNTAAAEYLAQNGFSRMVCAREMSKADLKSFCENSPIESEVFVHGALCVCHSGQCLFSSAVGGRSGNRGECAQPCRLPYKNGKGLQNYPLSLKDLSLAEHIRELCDMGVSSLKIEGRMKSPEYVGGVVRIWRRLLDAGKDASAEDMRELAEIFSRSGFTDGYFTGRINSQMLGVRSEEDKKKSNNVKAFTEIERKIPISLCAKIKEGQPSELTASRGERKVTVYGAKPEKAVNAPLCSDVVKRNLSKLGGTCYRLESIEAELDEGLMMPISALNALRRSAVEALSREELPDGKEIREAPLSKPVESRGNRISRTATFYDAAEVPKEAENFFDRIFIPLEQYSGQKNRGVMLPEVIYDGERQEVREMLSAAYASGARDALVGNVGHVSLAKEAGFKIYGDFRLNMFNDSSIAEAEKMGFEDVILSPELTMAQIRDATGNSRATVYGRLPLMITEKCLGKELGGCRACGEGKTLLTDRRGTQFPVRRRWKHRSVIFNSVPVYMADRQGRLRENGVTLQHFIFTVESKEQARAIIQAYRNGEAPKNESIKRIK